MKDFFEKYDRHIIPEPNSGCFLWIGAQITYGYGHGHRDNIHFYAHRAAYESAHGAGSANGLVVRHQCDTPPCCNPGHLLIGTHADNAKDAKDRGRLNPAKGTDHHRAILTDTDVLAMRQMAADGMSINAITELYPVRRNAITDAITGRKWAHLPHATDFVRQPSIPPVTRGENNASAILTAANVADIRDALANNTKGVDLARRYGVSPCTISAIKKGRNWK